MNKLISFLFFLIVFQAFGVLQTAAWQADTVYADTAYSSYASTPVPYAELKEDEWQKLTSDKEFSYKDEKELAGKKPEAEAPRNTWFDDFFTILFSKEGRYVLWTLLFLILAFAIFKFIMAEKSFMFGRSKKQVVVDAAEIIEEDLLEVNWEQRLEEMVRTGDLRLAVRYSYMWMLQLLQKKDLIKYRIDKTNYDYAAELTDKFKQPFRQITRQYEFSWYGHYPVNDDDYYKFKEEFTAIKNQIHAN